MARTSTFFLPESSIRSLGKSPDFVVSSVRTDWQAIHLPQVEQLLQNNHLVFAEVYYTFGPALLERAATRGFESVRVFLLPLPLNTSPERVMEVMKGQLERRATESPEKIRDRSSSAPTEIEKASTYTHRLVNPAGEDDVAEWESLGTCGGE